jgi:tRNA pseudouridine55 synthase
MPSIAGAQGEGDSEGIFEGISQISGPSYVRSGRWRSLRNRVLNWRGMDGVIVVNKPPGWTSHDAVNKIRWLAKTKKVGHLGTLDPMATGVLPLVAGRATRLAQFYMRRDKTYEAVIRFGYASDTFDAEGAPVTPIIEPEITLDQIEPLLERFRGELLQTPPPISAKKVGGTPAYRLARKQIPVELEPVPITIHSLDLLFCQGTDISIRVSCTAGTYLRVIAHELGQMAGHGAVLHKLVRTVSGDFTLDQARSMDELEAMAREERLEEALIPTSSLLPEFPSERVDMLTAGQIRQGRDFRVSPFHAQGAKYVKAVSPDGHLIAIGQAKLPNIYHPFLVL